MPAAWRLWWPVVREAVAPDERALGGHGVTQNSVATRDPCTAFSTRSQHLQIDVGRIVEAEQLRERPGADGL